MENEEQILGQMSQAFFGIEKEYLNGIADRSVVEIKRESPKDTGVYANGWTKEKDSKGNISLVNNSKHAYIAIFLEYGYHDGKERKFIRPRKHIYNSIKKSI